MTSAGMVAGVHGVQPRPSAVSSPCLNSEKLDNKKGKVLLH